MTARVFLMLLCLTGIASPVLALDMSIRPNAAEMMSMPPFCAAKFNLKQGSPEWNAWRDRIGENFIDIHHYCFALVAVKRYWGARTKQDRGFYLQRALNNYDYIVNAAKPDFALRAEVHAGRGEVFMLMGRPGEAAKDFNQALAINPGFVKPYLQLADLYAASKSTARALDITTEGLRRVPDSTALQRRYLELGGKKPFPEPNADKMAEAETSTATEETQTDPAPVPAATSQAEPATTTAPVPAVGVPGNPYCRFCPSE